MRRKARSHARLLVIPLVLLLAGCGGGGGGGSDIDVNSPPEPEPGAFEPNRFLLFPNPQQQADGTLQTDTVEYAQAYYRAIDPANAKDTLSKWMAANGFGSGTGTEVMVVFGDVRDLGYGRRMTVRQNADGTVAAFVENYLVEPAAVYTYSRVNLDAAVAVDRRWHLATNAIEFSPGPAGGLAFTKFYTFNADTGAREFTANMDGRGEKALPSVCVSCHGGRADPLTAPNAGGVRLFPLIAHSPTGQRGDVLGRMQPLEADTFDFHGSGGFTRTDQEAALKAINRMVLCTYPIAAASAFPEDACRRVAAANEWQGTAANLIKTAYGGNGLPSPTYADTYIPNNWLVSGQSSLYRDVVAPYCRGCHLLRGTGAQSDIDFDAFTKFLGSADRIKAHVIDRGNMPLARIVYDAFWGNGSAVGQTASFLEGAGFAVRDGAGAVLRPGRPVADPGPNRVARPGAIPLSASMSLFANAYRWSIVSDPGGASLANATTASPTLTAPVDGTYVVQLIASQNGVDSAPANLQIVVTSALALAPAAIRFSHIKTMLQTAGCTVCHAPGGAGLPPIVFTDIDRNGDAVAGDATDDVWFYTEVRGRVNFTDIVASPLLRKPAGFHHNGGAIAGFAASAAPGDPTRQNYDLVLNWILNGAPM